MNVPDFSMTAAAISASISSLAVARPRDTVRAPWRFASGVALGLAAVLLITWAAFQLQLNMATVGFLQLLAIVFLALEFGFWTATANSLVAVACLDYFFVPPIFTFNVNESVDWIALIVFESCALIVSSLSTQARHEALRAATQTQHTERLYEASRQVLLLDRKRSPGPQITMLIKSIFSTQCVVLFDAANVTLDSTGELRPETEALTRNAYLKAENSVDEISGTWFRVLRLGTELLGSLALQGNSISAPVADALASLTAIALERARSFESESRAEAARRAEQLRASVLDALAHDFKSPLTVIRTASTGLLEAGALSGTQSKLVTLIDKESSRLNDFATRLLLAAELDDTKAVRLNLEEVVLAKFVESRIARLEKHVADRVVLNAGQDHAVVSVDENLMGMALAELIKNAAKYSTPGTPITVATQAEAGKNIISVHNVGSTIAPADRERIFERFYRSANSVTGASGTGLGLSFTKNIALAHQGRVWVVSDEDKGTTFCLALPALPALPVRNGV